MIKGFSNRLGESIFLGWRDAVQFTSPKGVVTGIFHGLEVHGKIFNTAEIIPGIALPTIRPRLGFPDIAGLDWIAKA